MKTNSLLITLVLLSCGGAEAEAWQPVGDRIRTRWAAEVDSSCPLPEYPRPALVRDRWQNLNGLWDYAIRSVSEAEPVFYDGRIPVPFPVESALSGEQREVGAANALWHRRSFTIPTSWKDKCILLHFGAVDYETKIYLNGVMAGSHSGGYAAFHLAPYLTRGEQRLVVRVWDTPGAGYQPKGKERTRPAMIWYTSVTDIWQTVWIEPVGADRIESLVRSAASEEPFRREWRGIIDQLRCSPSIVMWVPFTEEWGQFKTREIAEYGGSGLMAYFAYSTLPNCRLLAGEESSDWPVGRNLKPILWNENYG